MSECLNCHANVLPKSDGRCPNCSEPANVAVRPERTLLTVTETDRLPDVCCGCATGTSRRESFAFSRDMGGEWTQSGGGLLGWLFHKLQNRARLRISMPYCEACRARSRLAPRDVRFEDFTMHEPASGECVAGVCHARGANSDLPPQWMMYVIVADVARAARIAVKHGGKVVVKPRAVMGGRFCVVRDPAGAVCGLYQAPKPAKS